MGIGKCRECGKEASSEAKACPHCGASKPVAKGVGLVGWIGVVFCGFVIFSIVSPSKSKSLSSPDPVAVVAPVMTKEQSCTEGIAKVIKSAKDELAAGRPRYAVDQLEACEKLASDPEVRALLKVARTQVTADAAKAEKLAKHFAAAEKARKKREGVRIGMSQQDVVDSNWGRPKDINRTTGSYGTHEQWVYDGGYLYFENGTLKTIQN